MPDPYPKPERRAPKRRGHNSTLAAPTTEMRSMSEKRERLYREVYRPMRREAVGDGYQPCEIGSPDCTKYGQHLHEVLSRGRAGGLAAALRDGPVMLACDACNSYVSEHPVWARERGLLVRKGGQP